MNDPKTYRDLLLGLVGAAVIYVVIRARKAREAAAEEEGEATMPRALNVALSPEEAEGLPTAAVPASFDMLTDILDLLPDLDDLGQPQPKAAPAETAGFESAPTYLPASRIGQSGPLVPAEVAPVVATKSTPNPAAGQVRASPIIEPSPVPPAVGWSSIPPAAQAHPLPVMLPVPPTTPGAEPRSPIVPTPVPVAPPPGGLAPVSGPADKAARILKAVRNPQGKRKATVAAKNAKKAAKPPVSR